MLICIQEIQIEKNTAHAHSPNLKIRSPLHKIQTTSLCGVVILLVTPILEGSLVVRILSKLRILFSFPQYVYHQTILHMSVIRDAPISQVFPHKE